MKKKASPRIGFGLSHQRDLTVNIVCQPSIFEDIGTRGESTLTKTGDAQRKEVFGGGECEDHPTSVLLRLENAMPYQRTYRRKQSSGSSVLQQQQTTDQLSTDQEEGLTLVSSNIYYI